MKISLVDLRLRGIHKQGIATGDISFPFRATPVCNDKRIDAAVKKQVVQDAYYFMFELMAVVWEENILFLAFTVPEVERMPSLF